jgi:hypothetical protein
MNKPPSRSTVRDKIDRPIGKFAVMRHSSKLSRAHFRAIHDDYASASAEAIRLVSEQASTSPELQHTYYVLEIVAFFSAGAEGLHSQER